MIIETIETRTTGKPARYSANGKRISREEYWHLHNTAKRADCHTTRAWPLGGGGTKRKNYTTLHF